jgi:hypothetical protein
MSEASNGSAHYQHYVEQICRATVKRPPMVRVLVESGVPLGIPYHQHQRAGSTTGLEAFSRLRTTSHMWVKSTTPSKYIYAGATGQETACWLTPEE